MLRRLLAEIGSEKENKTIIFVETKRKVDELLRCVRHDGWPAVSIHGDKTQQERDHVLQEFRSGRAPVLVATDVAARGLELTQDKICDIPDVEDVKFVINFDYPSSSEDYIHRIGRTGRSVSTGTAYAFFTPHNAKHAHELISVLQEANQVVNPRLSEMAALAQSGGLTGRGRWSGGSRGSRSSRGDRSSNSGGRSANRWDQTPKASRFSVPPPLMVPPSYQPAYFNLVANN